MKLKISRTVAALAIFAVTQLGPWGNVKSHAMDYDDEIRGLTSTLSAHPSGHRIRQIFRGETAWPDIPGQQLCVTCNDANQRLSVVRQIKDAQSQKSFAATQLGRVNVESLGMDPDGDIAVHKATIKRHTDAMQTGEMLLDHVHYKFSLTGDKIMSYEPSECLGCQVARERINRIEETNEIRRLQLELLRQQTGAAKTK